MKVEMNEIFKKLYEILTVDDYKIIAMCDGYGNELKIKILKEFCEIPSKIKEEVNWNVKEELCLTKWDMCYDEYKPIKENNELCRVLFSVLVLIEWGTNYSFCTKIFGICNEIIIAVECTVRLGGNWCELLYFYLKAIHSEIYPDILGEDYIYLPLGIYMLSIIISISKEEIELNKKNVLKAREYLIKEYELNYNTKLTDFSGYMQTENLWQKNILLYCGSFI